MTFAISTASWGWPQWFMAATILFTLITAAVFHGKAHADYNFPIRLMDMAITVIVLVFGGFFS